MTTIPEMAAAMAPILLQCAGDRQRITYGEAADEMVRLGLVESAHSLNVGDAAGRLMDDLLERNNGHLLPLNCLVVSGKDGLPSGGAAFYVKEFVQDEDESAYNNLTPEEKKKFLEYRIWPAVYAYDWNDILCSHYKDETGNSIPNKISLNITNKNLDPAKNREPDGEGSRSGFGGPAESPEHEALKIHVRDHPSVLKAVLPIESDRYTDRIHEYRFPSLDTVDVLIHPSDTTGNH